MPNEYVIITDSGSDLSAEMAAELGVEIVPLSYSMNDGESIPGNRVDLKQFYAELRAGGKATTSAANLEDFTKVFEGYANEGKDVLYIGFSSGLSSTASTGRLACSEISEAYPNLKFYAIDSLCASLGLGLLVYHAVQMKNEGKTIEEVRDWVEANKMCLCHHFTVDDLFFLKRGGRVSAATAVVGSMLAIKPLLHVDDAGKLISIGKARGRKGSLEGLVKACENTAIDPEKQVMFISHGDCEDEALQLAEMVKAKVGSIEVRTGCIGPVIGAHSGPGTLALFFLGTER
ncbi:MAG: DegV family protein [Clostridia bacterium]|nr:DegV family protein [Clostridia bacterium]